jgi:hypothetical protein
MLDKITYYLFSLCFFFLVWPFSIGLSIATDYGKRWGHDWFFILATTAFLAMIAVSVIIGLLILFQGRPFRIIKI